MNATMMARIDPLKPIDEEKLQFSFENDMIEYDRKEFEYFKDLVPKRRQPIVCVHWLRGLCHKNRYTCDRLHVYDSDLLPICQFYIKGECTNGDCMFRHPTHEKVDLYCIAYAKGFCSRGPCCTERHVVFDKQEISKIPTHVKVALETHRRAQKKAERYQYTSQQMEIEIGEQDDSAKNGQIETEKTNHSSLKRKRVTRKK